MPESRKKTEVVVTQCQNCSSFWDESELNPLRDATERVAPGERMPEGECPLDSCGAVCHAIEEDHIDGCPMCSGGIILTGFTASCRIGVTKLGWDLTGGPCDTSDESFACPTHGNVPSLWVFKRLSRKDATDNMTKANPECQQKQ